MGIFIYIGSNLCVDSSRTCKKEEENIFAWIRISGSEFLLNFYKIFI